MGLRIGVLGSAFSPITRAHLLIALQAALQAKLDKVILTPSADSRKDKVISLNSEHRWNMVNLAIEDSPLNQYGEPLFIADRYEMDNTEDKQYSYFTMEHYKKQYPNDELFFILGADILEDLPTWTFGKEFLENNKFVVFQRQGKDINETFQNDEYLDSLKSKFYIINKGISFEISSSYIRNKFAKKENPQYLLSEKVYEYIINNKIYNSENYLNNKNECKKRIGIFGSGFDPVTIPQLYTALEVAKKMKLEKVIFVPSSRNRNDKQMVLSEEHRWNLLQLALEDSPKNMNGEPLFEVSDFEMKSIGGQQYTYYTMQYFRKKYHDHEVFFIIGEDVIQDISRWNWRSGKKLVEENQFIVMKREGYDINQAIANDAFLRYNSYGKFNLIYKDISLEVPYDYIKEDFENGGNPKYLLPTKCHDYIVQNKLYTITKH
jgi:nicotinate-nucleotide adenylyltransferase